MTNNADQPTSHQVADFFLANRDDEDGLTHLKLQKLCYYAQVFHLALIGRRLFDEQLLAWDHGPVTRSIWDRFAYQRGVLPRPEDFDSTSLSAAR